MAKLLDAEIRAVELEVADRLGLNLSQIVAGSITLEADAAGERVSWRGQSEVEPGFMQSVFDEVRR